MNLRFASVFYTNNITNTEFCDLDLSTMQKISIAKKLDERYCNTSSVMGQCIGIVLDSFMQNHVIMRRLKGNKYNGLSFKLYRSNSIVLNLWIQQRKVYELHNNNHLYNGI